MRQFTDKVVEFAWDFMVEDVQQVLKCEKDEAIHVISKAFKRFGTYHSVTKKVGKVFQMKAPIAVIEERVQLTRNSERPKPQYSNENVWDKYSD